VIEVFEIEQAQAGAAGEALVEGFAEVLVVEQQGDFLECAAISSGVASGLILARLAWKISEKILVASSRLAFFNDR